MRRHNTEKEKKARIKAYKKLRRAGISSRVAVVLRDWTDAKIKAIVSGKARPVIMEAFGEKCIKIKH